MGGELSRVRKLWERNCPGLENGGRGIVQGWKMMGEEYVQGRKMMGEELSGVENDGSGIVQGGK